MREPTYRVGHVVRLLRSYVDIRLTLEGKGQRLQTTYSTPKPKTLEGRIPLGRTKNDPSWPFMGKPHARSPMDGKMRARFFEELHCSALDLEEGLERISEDDHDLIAKYHIWQTHTLEELMAERGLSTKSKGAMQRRVFRAVRRLTNEMEKLYAEKT